MITVSTKPNDKNLYVRIETGIGWTIELECTRACEMDAILLSNEIKRTIDRRMESIRKRAYNQGWKDKASKKERKKKQFHSTTRDTEFIGY